MAIKIIQKITSLFRKNSENLMTGARKVNNRTKVKLTQEPDVFIPKEEILKHDPDRIAYEHLQTDESKQFRAEMEQLIAERRKLRQQNKS